MYTRLLLSWLEACTSDVPGIKALEEYLKLTSSYHSVWRLATKTTVSSCTRKTTSIGGSFSAPVWHVLGSKVSWCPHAIPLPLQRLCNVGFRLLRYVIILMRRVSRSCFLAVPCSTSTL